MIYKTFQKVSNVCQLLNKSKYHATQTINGVTFTNNGDGSFTVNGTASAYTVFYIKRNDVMKKKQSIHKYLFIGAPICSKSTIFMELLGRYDGKSVWQADIGNGKFFECTELIDLYIAIQNGYTANNLVFKPQLFDLTEMYRAGNEPTTVEQFRQDFPEEMYDYKPYCFVKSYKTLLKATDNKIITSYKKSLVCKTKNLFDNIPVKTNYIINSNGEEVATSGYNIYGKMYGNNFTISTNTPVDLNGSDNWLRVCLYNSEGTFITRKDFDFNIRTVTNIADDNIAYIRLCFHRKSFSNYKLQVELGTTATDYVPYGHL